MPSPGFFYGSLPPSLQQSYKYDPREQLAEQLLEQGTSQRPLRGGATEGVLRLANALLGGYNQRKLGQEYQQRGDQYNQGLAGALSGVKAGHFETGQDGQPAWVPTDISPLTQFAQNNPDANGLAQQIQVAGIESGLSTDKTIQALQAKQLYDPPDWQDPRYQDFELRKARASAEIYAPIRADALANQAANYSEDVRHNKAMEDIGRTNAENRPPPVVVYPDGSLHYATGPVGGQQAPAKASAMSLQDRMKLKQAPTAKDVQGVRDSGAMYDKALSALDDLEKYDKQLGVTESGKVIGHAALTDNTQNYDLAAKRLSQALVGALRVPGEALRTNYEQQAIMGQVPDRTYYDEPRRAQLKALRETITQIRDERRGAAEQANAEGLAPTVAPSSAPSAPKRIKFGDLPQ